MYKSEFNTRNCHSKSNRNRNQRNKTKIVPEN